MIKITLLCAIIVLADTSTKTILQDIRDYEQELQKNHTNIQWYMEYIKNKQKKDPCEPFVPMTPNVANLGTLSEKKCKEYMWYFKNEMNNFTQQQFCAVQKYLSNIDNVSSNQSSGGTPGVYGGRPVEINEFPHMGAIGWKSKDPSKEWVFKCGSTLISDKFLLTAAHCTKLSPRFVTDIINGDPDVVMLGVNDIADIAQTTKGKEERRPHIAKIQNIIVHPEYKAPKKYNDIALLEVDAIEFTRFIKPACVWPHKSIKVQDQFYVTGWGETESGRLATHMQAGEVEIIDVSTCEDLLTPYHNRNWNGFTDNQMCAGKLEGGVDTCQGDSGGPLQVKLEPIPQIESLSLVVGVTSFGIRCGVRNQPGVYTKVASFIDWIEEHVWSDSR